MDIDIIGLKSAHNIVDYIDKYVPLKKQGKDYFGCCPFHGENTPSFSVNEQKQFYHCFGCGANGDIVKFIMDYNGSDFLQACEMLGHNAALNPSRTIKNIQDANKRARNILPFDREPYSQDELAKVFGMCEQYGPPGNEIFILKGSQVVMATDANKNPVTAVMLDGAGMPPRFYKKDFIHGSCVIFGELSPETKSIHLCEDYFAASNLNKTMGLTTVCFFDAHNLYFIYEQVRKHTSNILVVCHSDEAEFQAEKMCLVSSKVENVTQLGYN